MGISQSTLSNHVSTLEKNLGVTLFIRSNKSVSLSPEGQILYPVFKKACVDMEKAVLAAHRLHESHANILRFGLIKDLKPEILEEIKGLLDDFCEQNPQISFQFYSLAEKEIVTMLRNHELDLAYTIDGSLKMHPEIMYAYFKSNTIGILYSADKFGSDRTIDYLKNKTLIIPEREVNPSDDYYVQEFKERYGVNPKSITVNSTDAKYFYVFAGQGIGFSDTSTRRSNDENYGMCLLEDFLSGYGFAALRNIPNPIVHSFFEYVESKVQK